MPASPLAPNFVNQLPYSAAASSRKASAFCCSLPSRSAGVEAAIEVNANAQSFGQETTTFFFDFDANEEEEEDERMRHAKSFTEECNQRCRKAAFRASPSACNVLSASSDKSTEERDMELRLLSSLCPSNPCTDAATAGSNAPRSLTKVSFGVRREKSEKRESRRRRRSFRYRSAACCIPTATFFSASASVPGHLPGMRRDPS